ncbi:hypothetical protein [Nocardia sp. NBC_00416]|uniref:hypothetical protein n=1 Tax=Nocardia sp. NBC_00416 TaxID=2975991 RepID=UPI002E221F26
MQDAIRKLAEWGVTMLVGEEVYEQPEPGAGERYIDRFPWKMAWRAALDHPRLSISG